MYATKCEMCPHPWHAAIIVLDDGQARMNRHLISPDRPVKVQLAGAFFRPDSLQKIVTV